MRVRAYREFQKVLEEGNPIILVREDGGVSGKADSATVKASNLSNFFRQENQHIVLGSEPEEVKEHTIMDRANSRYVHEEVISSSKEDGLTLPRSNNHRFDMKKGSHQVQGDAQLQMPPDIAKK